MRLPRDVSGQELARRLEVLGYEMVRQSGSHMRLTTLEHGEHHITIPRHNPLRIGTLSAVVANIATHFEMSREELAEQLFGKGQ